MRKPLFALAAIILFLASAPHAFCFPAKKVYQKTSRSVVLIVSKTDGGGSLVGAGSLVSASGLVITNAHVVVEKERSRPFAKIKVFVKPDEVTGDLSRDLVNRYDARVVAYDLDLDLALLEVRGLPRDIGAIVLADPGDIMVGEEVVAIGHPEQGGLWSLTYGRISGQIANQSNVKGKDVFQTDTSVNRGNSGGPLLDGRGYMVGVNTNIARLGADNLPITGVNFAVKSSVVRDWLGTRGVKLAYGRESLDGEGQVPVPVRSVGPSEKPEEGEEAPAGAGPGAEAEKAAGPPPVHEGVEPSEKQAEKDTTGEGGPQDRMTMAEEERLESDTVLTPEKPLDYDRLFEEVEKEMEDMMEEMRIKIRKR